MKKLIAFILFITLLIFSLPASGIMVTAWYSEGGAAKTGLSVTVDIRDVSDGSLDVDDGAMTEVGDGWYRYDFSGADDTKDYTALCDGGSGLCDPERYVPGEFIQSVTAGYVWNARLTGATYNDATSAGRRLRQSADVMIVREETCQAGGGNDEVILDASASATNDFYIYDFIILTSGTGGGQVRHIDSYNGGTKTCTVNRNWDTNPDATTGYMIKADSTKHVHGFLPDAKAEINAEVDNTFDTAIPAVPTAGSANEKLKRMR